MSFLVLYCLILGVGVVAYAQRTDVHRALLERIGAMMVMGALVGLGFVLAKAG